MTFRRRQILGWGVLLIVAALGASWLLRLDYSRKISTDVLDLVPSDERAPELTLVRSLASQAEARAMFFELMQSGGKPAPAEAATRFAAALAQDPAFDQAIFMGDTSARDALGRELFEQRFQLLFPLWLNEKKSKAHSAGDSPADFSSWLAHEAAADLSRFLATPEALAFESTIPSDPLLLMPGAVERLKDGLSLVQPATASANAPTLVWARLSASPLSEAGQNPAFAAIERAIGTLRTDYPGFTVAYTGVNRFAAASRARIEHEVTWLNALSLTAVLAVAFTFIRSVYRGLHLVPVVLLSVLGAWVCTTLAFERIHIMVFAVGSLLTGVAIDYGFYLFMQPPAQPDEDYWAKVRRLAKPLLASCLTTVAGFTLLLFSELPFIRQLGVFVGTGLISALASAVLYFSTVRNPYLEARRFQQEKKLPARTRQNLRRAVTVLWIIALPGLALLKWKDDIRELEIPSPELKREDARITGLFGDPGNRTVYLTYGKTLSEARDSLEKLEGWLNTAAGGHAKTIGLGAVVPSARQYEEAREFVRSHPQFPDEFRAALGTAGFESTGFEPFFTAFAAYEATKPDEGVLPALKALQLKLMGPVGLLVHLGEPLNWFVTIARDASSAAPPAETHTITSSQLQSLNQIFSRYRQSALWLSLTGLAIVGIGVFLSYGWKDGARIFVIPCGTCLGLFGLFGWIGHPLNLFHLLGAFLGVCLTHNYSIFSATSAYRAEAPPVSVRMSAMTTAASFGVLALSGIPVVRALGSTVALMVIAALLVIEFEHLAALGEKIMNELLQSWEKTLRRHGHKQAMVEAAGEKVVTFHELDALSHRWLEQHAGQAVLRGASVVFAAPNGVTWLTIFLALTKAGAVTVPLDAAEPLAARRKLADVLRADFWWDGEKIAPLAPPKRRASGETCLVKLTSGTTGTPRALRFNARQLLADASQVTSTMGITARDLNFALIPLGHSYGLGNLTLPLLAHGVPLVCGTSPLPHAIATDFARWRPTVFPGVPAMWRALAGSDVSLDSLRLGISAGAPLPATVAQEFATRLGLRLHNYGSSETGGITYDRSGKATLAGGVGRALRGVTLNLIGPSRLEVSSAAVVTQGNRRCRKKIGAWLMADAVALSLRGELSVLGRRGRTVKIAGRRVNLEEVTARLRQINGVKEAWAAVGNESDPLLGAVVATELTAAELRSALHADTASWKIPKKWRIVASLPLTPRGKPDSTAMRAMLF